MTLSWADVRSIIDSVTYKPGWSISMVASNTREDGARSFESPYMLNIQARVHDSRQADPHDPQRASVGIAWSEEIPYAVLHTSDEVLSHIRHVIDGLERHERDEWFAVDGVLVKDPHGGSQPVPVTPPFRATPERLHDMDEWMNMTSVDLEYGVGRLT